MSKTAFPDRHHLLDLVLCNSDGTAREEWQFHLHGVLRSVIMFRVIHHLNGYYCSQVITNVGVTDRRRKLRESRQIIYRGPSLHAASAALSGFVEAYLGTDVYEELL